MKRDHFEIDNPKRAERALLVGHATRDVGGALERSLEELALLADTAGAKVMGRLAQRRGAVHPATFIGKGKLDELKAMAEEHDADLVVFDDDLSPAQMRNLEKALDRKVIDRSELILDIFAKRARTRESRLQVELAQLEYTLPRLTGMWKHLERQAGGIGTRGPGETQLETDRRLVRERIARLKNELDGVEREREIQRRRRRREFRAALVGYTNAGKSTLFNALTRSDVFVEDRLFATLDATTRQMVSPRRENALLTDTVGFIRKLPHHLVASFHSTLVEAIEADLLLHVVDAADPSFREHITAVEGVLSDILVTPRETRLVFNKVDAITDEDLLAALRAEFPGALLVSAKRGEGLEELRSFVWASASEMERDAARVRARAAERDAGDPVVELEFDATLAAPPARVFSALTEATHLARWFSDSAESVTRLGGRLLLEWEAPDPAALPFEGHWTSIDPVRHCAYEGGHAGYPDGYAGLVEFSLKPEGRGTQLLVRHTLPDRKDYAPFIARYRGAWPRALERLSSYLTPDL